jgi:hypothetical protein
MSKLPEIYTQEHIVYAHGVDAADITKPIYVYADTAGHHAVSDGNHRCTKAFIEGKLNELPRTVIGQLPRDVSQDPDYKPIAQLIIVGR